jgi:hypothetical protein
MVLHMNKKAGMAEELHDILKQSEMSEKWTDNYFLSTHLYLQMMCSVTTVKSQQWQHRPIQLLCALVDSRKLIIMELLRDWPCQSSHLEDESSETEK